MSDEVKTTLELCIALRENGYQPEAKADPETWNEGLHSRTDENDGYVWVEHPELGWYPNPGRKALVKEIIAILGQDTFNAKYGDDADVYQTRSHEGWMQEWLNAKATFVPAGSVVAPTAPIAPQPAIQDIAQTVPTPVVNGNATSDVAPLTTTTDDQSNTVVEGTGDSSELPSSEVQS